MIVIDRQTQRPHTVRAVLQVELPPTPSYPPSLPAVRFGIDEGGEVMARLHGTPVALSVGGRTFTGTAWMVASLGGRVGSVRIGFGRIPFDDLRDALVSLYVTACRAGKGR